MYGVYEGGAVIARFAAPLVVRSNVPVFASDTLSLKRRPIARPAQRWEVTSEVVPLTTDANELFSLLVEKGNSEPLIIAIPQNYGVIHKRVSVGLAPTATGSKDASTVAIVNNTGQTIPRGCFIRFANHTKVYMVKQGSLTGNGTLNIFPALQAAVPAGTIVKWLDDVLLQAFLDTDAIVGMTYTDGIMMNPGKLTFLEDLIGL